MFNQRSNNDIDSEDVLMSSEEEGNQCEFHDEDVYGSAIKRQKNNKP